MILLSLRRWRTHGGIFLMWDRLYIKGYFWTPFCKVRKRHSEWLGYFKGSKAVDERGKEADMVITASCWGKTGQEQRFRVDLNPEPTDQNVINQAMLDAICHLALALSNQHGMGPKAAQKRITAVVRRYIDRAWKESRSKK